MGDEVTDSILMNLASRTQSIDGLLSAMFGFLHRKTDFYVVDDSPSRRMGFASGEAKKKVALVMSIAHSFVRWLLLAPCCFREILFEARGTGESE